MVVLKESPSDKKSVLAVVVLYRRAPLQSPTLNSLAQIFEAFPETKKHFSTVVFDNSPESHALEPGLGFPVLYKHEPDNVGLAEAYNFALQQAEQEKCEWLLLLDQDTSLSVEFVMELVGCIHALIPRPDVVSIVPKLVVGERIISPVAHFIDQLRGQFKRSANLILNRAFGVQEGRLAVYNSGAAIRVSALRSIGGFPKEFWLDYLDHAVFHALFTRGYRLYLMESQISHNPSQADVSSVPSWRQRNLLNAQTLFVKQTGNVWDRLLYRIWLLRYSRVLWVKHSDRNLWREAALHAVFLRTETNDELGHRSKPSDS